MISTLPLEEAWVPLRLRKYQEVWIPEHTLPGQMAAQQHFKARPDDILLSSYPKSGTTWLKALAFATMTRTQYPLSQHPLLSHNPHLFVVFLDRLFSDAQAPELEAATRSPRILNSHLPYNLLPDSIKGSEGRIIYICRDPKDVLVSRIFFHGTMISKDNMERISLTKAFELFCEGICPFGSIWDHVLEFREESLRRPHKVLFLKYEEMMTEPVANVKRLAEFMGCPFSQEEEKGGVVEEIIELCSFQKLSKLEANKKEMPNVPNLTTFASLFRKGEVGDWKNHLSPEMVQKLDDITQQKLGRVQPDP